MDVKDHFSLAELKQLARAERDAKLSKRMQMVVLRRPRGYEPQTYSCLTA